MLSAKTHTKKIGGSRFFLLPDKLRTDSQFPFNGQELIMSIKGNKIIIEEDLK